MLYSFLTQKLLKKSNKYSSFNNIYIIRKIDSFDKTLQVTKQIYSIT